MHEIITQFIVDILANKIKTVILEFIPTQLVTSVMRNNITGITAQFYKVEIPCVLVDSIMFGDDNVFPESLEHANSLLGDDTIFANNHIILSNNDDLNIRHIYNKIDICKNRLSPIDDMELKAIIMYSDGCKEEKYGTITSGYRN